MKRVKEEMSKSLKAFTKAFASLGGNQATITDLIDYFSYFPSYFLQVDEPNNNGQNELIEELSAFYINTADWLRVRLEARNDLYPRLATYAPQYKSFADLSVARLEFCYQCWIALPFAQQIAINHLQLWFFCEMSECIYRLRASGFWGNPVLNNDGKTFGKRELIANRQAIINKAIKSIDWNGDLSEVDLSPATDEDFVERLTNVLWDLTMQQAMKHNDNRLKHHCKIWLLQEMKYDQESKGSNNIQNPYIRGNSLDWTAKGKKAWKPPSGKGRGRPPLGSKKSDCKVL